MSEEVKSNFEVSSELKSGQSLSPTQSIPVHIIKRPFSHISTAPSSKGRYYKQTYRSAWEQMPDFAGWLKGVEGEPTRAFCIYCQKTLHAHRLSLLKHTCTIRHQKAAQANLIKKTKMNCNTSETTMLSHPDSETQDSADDEDALVEYADSTPSNMDEIESSDMNQITHEPSEDEDGTKEIVETIIPDFHQYTQPIEEPKPPISTEVIDSTKGVPAAGLQVSLYKLIEGRWTYINEGFTNYSGRFDKFVDRTNCTLGRYKLHYDVDRYFESKKQESLYPFIEIVFDIKGKNANYHIPLILSANGYTTYKGIY